MSDERFTGTARRMARGVLYCVSLQSANRERAGRGCRTQEGDRVQFRVSDVFLPGPEELLTAPPTQSELEGTVVDFSDSGATPRFFALVEVVTRKTLVIPVEKLKMIEMKDR
jgi:hypothetical protein